MRRASRCPRGGGADAGHLSGTPPVELELEPSSFSDSAAVDDEDRGAPETLADRVEFGGPEVAALDGTYHPEDADLQAFVKARAASFRFVLVVMSVNFRFGRPRLSTASVEVDLGDDTGTGRTLAYSISPAMACYAKDVSRGFTVQPNLTIAGTGGSIGGPSWTTVHHGTEPYLIGGPELSARPAWRYQRTRGQEIVGPTRLTMVIQCRPTGPAR